MARLLLLYNRRQTKIHTVEAANTTEISIYLVT